MGFCENGKLSIFSTTDETRKIGYFGKWRFWGFWGKWPKMAKFGKIGQNEDFWVFWEFWGNPWTSVSLKRLAFVVSFAPYIPFLNYFYISL